MTGHNTHSTVSHLTVLAKNRRWSPAIEIDWDQPVKRPWWMQSSRYAELMSQLMYGEELSLSLTQAAFSRTNGNTCPDFLATQMEDEVRHVKAYRLYLRKLGDISPQFDGFKLFVDQVEAWTGPLVAIDVAVHEVLEGDALMVQKNFQNWLSCPILRELHKRIVRDESRHVAYGKAVLPGRISALSPNEKIETAQWLENLWRTTFDTLAGRFATPTLCPRRLRTTLADQFWQPHARRLSDMGLPL